MRVWFCAPLLFYAKIYNMSEFTNEINNSPEPVEVKPIEQTWSTESRIKLVLELGAKIEDWIKANLPAYMNDEDRATQSYRLGYAINEVLVNAATYGNLQWKKPEGIIKMKQGERTNSIEKLEAARPDLAKKLVVIKITIKDNSLVATIKDEGQGFDLNAVPNPLDKDNIYNETGRGLEFPRKFFSTMETKKSEDGFEVILTKDLSGYKNANSAVT